MRVLSTWGWRRRTRAFVAGADIAVPDDIRALSGRPINGPSRSDCCDAYPMFRVVLPRHCDDAGARELLLCWHHFHRSQHALANAGAHLRSDGQAPASQ